MLRGGTFSDAIKFDVNKLGCHCVVAGLALAWFATLPAGAWDLGTNTTINASVAVREGYDDNVYLQDVPPNPAVPDAVPARKDSLFTVLTPTIRLKYHSSSNFMANLSYAPDFGFYSAASSENYIAHRVGLTLAGNPDGFEWEQHNSFAYVDGNRVNPTFGQTDGVPVMGGLAIRDRHAALVYRGGASLTYPLGRWFVRPIVSAYVHDFLTEQRRSPVGGRYENYVDRWELGGGLDAGYELFDGTSVYFGYRYGHQEQGSLLGRPGVFSNDYQRFLAGLATKPTQWLSFDFTVGPDFRSWPATTPAGFDPNEVYWYVNAAAKVFPTHADTLSLAMSRFVQTAFTSQSLYEDIRYEAYWRHKFSDRWTVGAGLALQIGNWRPPVHRKDWIYTPSAVITYQINRHCAVDAEYHYDWAESHVPNLQGIEYRQNVGWLRLTYSF